MFLELFPHIRPFKSALINLRIRLNIRERYPLNRFPRVNTVRTLWKQFLNDIKKCSRLFKVLFCFQLLSIHKKQFKHFPVIIKGLSSFNQSVTKKTWVDKIIERAQFTHSNAFFLTQFMMTSSRDCLHNSRVDEFIETASGISCKYDYCVILLFSP